MSNLFHSLVTLQQNDVSAGGDTKQPHKQKVMEYLHFDCKETSKPEDTSWVQEDLVSPARNRSGLPISRTRVLVPHFYPAYLVKIPSHPSFSVVRHMKGLLHTERNFTAETLAVLLV